MPVPIKKGLTKRQGAVLAFVKDFLAERGYPPTLREVCAHLGIKGPQNAGKHLTALERKGFIKRRPHASRGIEVIGASVSVTEDNPGAVAVPIAGSVKAGPPHLAVEDIQGHVTLDKRFFRCTGSSFILKAEGSSMTGAGIEDGDYLLIRPGAENGDIVVALLGNDDEATVKRFIKRGNSITLKPENPDMEPIKVRETENFSIVGHVASIIKRL